MFLYLNDGIICGISIIVSVAGQIFGFKTLVFAKVFVTQLKSIHNWSILKKIIGSLELNQNHFFNETLLWKHFTVSYD